MNEPEKQFLASRSNRNAALQASRDRRRHQDYESSEELSRDDFWSQFRTKSKSLQNELDSISSSSTQLITSAQRHAAWDQLSKSLSELESFHSFASQSLPSGDVRIVKEELQSLKETMVDVRDRIICPKERFVFRRYHSWQKILKDNGYDVKMIPVETVDEQPEQEKEKEEEEEETNRQVTTNKIIENQINQNIVIDDDHENYDESSRLQIKNLVGCHVILKQPFNSIHIHSLQNSTLLSYAPTSSSLLIHNCAQSKIIAAAKQFRIHDSQHVKFHIHTQSGPIIEHCSDLTFYGDYEKKTGTFVKGENEYRDVKDFNWLSVSKKSPNFEIVEVQEEEEEEVDLEDDEL